MPASRRAPLVLLLVAALLLPAAPARAQTSDQPRPQSALRELYESLTEVAAVAATSKDPAVAAQARARIATEAAAAAAKIRHQLEQTPATRLDRSRILAGQALAAAAEATSAAMAAESAARAAVRTDPPRMPGDHVDRAADAAGRARAAADAAEQDAAWAREESSRRRKADHSTRRPLIETYEEFLDAVRRAGGLPPTAHPDEIRLLDPRTLSADEKSNPIAAPLREPGVVDLHMHADGDRFWFGVHPVGTDVVAKVLLRATVLGQHHGLLRVNACWSGCPADPDGGLGTTLLAELAHVLKLEARKLGLDPLAGVVGAGDTMAVQPVPEPDPDVWLASDAVGETLGLSPAEWAAYKRDHSGTLRAMAERGYVIGPDNPYWVAVTDDGIRTVPPERLHRLAVELGVVRAGWSRSLPAAAEAESAETAARVAEQAAEGIARIERRMRRLDAPIPNAAVNRGRLATTAARLATQARNAGTAASTQAKRVADLYGPGWVAGDPAFRAQLAAIRARNAVNQALEAQPRIQAAADAYRARSGGRRVETAEALRSLIAQQGVVANDAAGLRLFPARDRRELAATASPVPLPGWYDLTLTTDGRRAYYAGREVDLSALAEVLISDTRYDLGPIRVNGCYVSCPASPDGDLRQTMAARLKRTIEETATRLGRDPERVRLLAPAGYQSRPPDDAPEGWVDQALTTAGATEDEIRELHAAQAPDLAAAERDRVLVGPDEGYWVDHGPGAPAVVPMRELAGLAIEPPTTGGGPSVLLPAP